jgi:hypothetical protein
MMVVLHGVYLMLQELLLQVELLMLILYVSQLLVDVWMQVHVIMMLLQH